MKNIALFILLVSVFACKNVEQYKAGITDLTTNWEKSTNEIAGFAQIVNGENSKIAEALNAAKLAPEALAKLKPAQKTAYDTAVAGVTTAGGNLGKVLSEVSTFVSDWTAKGAEVTALKDGLAAGKLEGDVAGKIAGLTKLVTESGTKLATWKEAFSNAQTESNAAQTALAAAMEAINGKVAPVATKK